MLIISNKYLERSNTHLSKVNLHLTLLKSNRAVYWVRHAERKEKQKFSVHCSENYEIETRVM